jgi:hypothetical protein
MTEVKFRNNFLFVFIVLLLAIFSANAVNANVDSSDNTTSNLKFITKEAKLNQNNIIQVQVLNSKNQTLENKTTNFYVYNKKSKKYKYIGKSITDTTGIATFKYKFKSYGKINVKTTVVEDNFEKSAKIFVPKAYLNIKNSYSKKVDGAILHSTIYNKGPKKTKFKIYYKFSKDFTFNFIPVKYKYTKPKVQAKGTKISKISVSTKGKYLYVYGTIKKKGKVKIKWAFESAYEHVSIKPVVKSGSTKILGNKPLKIKITTFTIVDDR